MRRFILKTTLYLLLILGGFELLFRLGFWPCITDSFTYDHKMLWLQQHPLKRTDLIAVGSSVPLYGLSSEEIVGHLPLSYYNFSSWSVRMADCWTTIRPIVRDYRPKYVILGCNLGDFIAAPDSTYLNYIDASPLLRRHLPEGFYFTHFTSIHQIMYRWFNRKGVVFDRWGGMLLEGPVLKMHIADAPKDPLQLPFDPRYQQVHYRALDEMSRWLRDQGIQLFFVQFPLPAKSMTNDSVHAKVNRHIETCRSIVEANGGIFLNYVNAFPYRDSLYVGALHLTPSGARVLTDLLVRDLQKVIGQGR